MRKFKPKIGQEYYMLNSRWDIKKPIHTGNLKSMDRIRAGNCFRTHAEAEAFKKRVFGATTHSLWSHFKKFRGKSYGNNKG